MTTDVCSQCGAVASPAASCRLCFEALLAFEAERPAVFGAVHHLTVATYSLQHPAGYAQAALDAWHALLADALDGRATVSSLRQRHGRQFAGSTRVAEPGASPPAGWPTQWSMTVQDLLTPLDALPDDDEYIARANAWAKATCAVLDAAQLSSPRP